MSSLFGDKYSTQILRCTPNLLERLEESKEIVDRAIKEHDPYAVVLMLSGGDDSITATFSGQVAKLED